MGDDVFPAMLGHWDPSESLFSLFYLFRVEKVGLSEEEVGN
jgi:hypothetical protein